MRASAPGPRGPVVVVLLAGLGCGTARPPPQGPLGGLGEGPDAREAARTLALARAELGDLLVLPPAPGREGVLPDLSPPGVRLARTQVDALHDALQGLDLRRLDVRGRREIRHGQVWIARARARWTGGRQQQAIFLDRGLARARAALAAGAIAASDLRRFLDAAAEDPAVAHERERAWALARVARHASATAPEEGASDLAPAWARFSVALGRARSLSPPPLTEAIALALGSTRTPDLERLEAYATEAMTRSRQRLYQLALAVVPVGPPGVERRVERAIPEARRAEGDVAVELAILADRTEQRLAAAGARGIRVAASPAGVLPGLRVIATGTVSIPVLLEALAPLGPDARDAWALERLAPAVVEAGVPVDRTFPPDETTTSALAHVLLDRLVEAPEAAPPATRLLLAATRLEQVARALAELRAAREGREAGIELLVENAWHEPETAEAVLDAARARPGCFAAPLAAVRAFSERSDWLACAGWPAAVCVREDERAGRERGPES